VVDVIKANVGGQIVSVPNTPVVLPAA